MATDITTRHDIEVLMNAFYKKALTDELIGFYFTDVVQLNLQKHLPIIVDFWENILLDAHYYNRDPMQIHKHIHQLHPFQSVHFDRWVQLFVTSVDELYHGEKAERAKQRAHSIAGIMKIKFIYPHG